jgi:hypothetical protein
MAEPTGTMSAAARSTTLAVPRNGPSHQYPYATTTIIASAQANSPYTTARVMTGRSEKRCMSACSSSKSSISIQRFIMWRRWITSQRKPAAVNPSAPARTESIIVELELRAAQAQATPVRTITLAPSILGSHSLRPGNTSFAEAGFSSKRKRNMTRAQYHTLRPHKTALTRNASICPKLPVSAMAMSTSCPWAMNTATTPTRPRSKLNRTIFKTR